MSTWAESAEWAQSPSYLRSMLLTTDMLETVRRTAVQDCGMQPGAPVLVALSGGADSVFLLLSLHTLGFACTAAHVNYGLRPEAGEETAFCRALCARLGVTLYIYEVPQDTWIPGQSVQQQARSLRYRFFQQHAGTGWIATGHQADDDAETILLHLLRGQNASVLTGIPVRRGQRVRPLLYLRSAHIRAALRTAGQDWREDSSNAGDAYLRNRLRHTLMPHLSRLNPRAIQQLQERTALYQQQQQWLRAQFQAQEAERVQRSARGVQVDLRDLSQPPEPFLWYLLTAAGWKGRDIRHTVHALCAAGQSRWHSPSGEAEWLSGRFFYRTAPWPAEEAPPALHIPTTGDWESTWQGFHLRVTRRSGGLQTLQALAPEPGAHTFALDAAALHGDLILRGPLPGDEMQPLGMQGRKKLTDIFQEMALPSWERPRQAVITDARQVLALLGYRIADPARVSPRTQELLVITFIYI